MELKEIQIEHMRPDPNNPRNDFGDIKALAKTFELTPGNPGEPLNPPVVVADGEDVYRIVDGERRFRAMKQAGRTACHAIVCDDMDEANSLVAMLATDDKAQLTEGERSRGVQQMLLLGVPERQIEAAARLKRGQAKKIRTAMDIVGEKRAQQMSLDWLFRIEDLRDAGANEEELAIVLDAEDDKRMDMLDAAIDAFERRQKKEVLLERFASAGMDVLSDGDDVPEGYGYALMVPSADKAEEYMRSGRNIGDILVWDDANNSVDVYRERAREDGAEANAEGAGSEEAARSRDAFAADLEAGCIRRIKWFAECLAPSGSKRDRRTRETPVLDRMVEGMAMETAGLTSLLQDFLGNSGAAAGDISIAAPRNLTGKVAAVLYSAAAMRAELRYHRSAVGRLSGGESLAEDDMLLLDRFADWMSAFELSGYRPDAADKRVMAAVSEALGFPDEETAEKVASDTGADDARDTSDAPGTDEIRTAPEVVIGGDLPANDIAGGDADGADPLDIASLNFGEPALAMA